MRNISYRYHFTSASRHTDLVGVQKEYLDDNNVEGKRGSTGHMRTCCSTHAHVPIHHASSRRQVLVVGFVAFHRFACLKLSVDKDSGFKFNIRRSYMLRPDC